MAPLVKSSCVATRKGLKLREENVVWNVA